MKKNLMFIIIFGIVMLGCDSKTTSDEIQSTQQEQLLKEATAKIGMPAIHNFRERAMMKQIYELRDQSQYITYTYVENMNPTVVKGHTALGGKFTYLGVSIGYPIPYSTQFTNPQQEIWHNSRPDVVLPQADPNGLFSPASADGTWVMLKDPNGDVTVQYIEPKIATFTYQLPMD